MTKPEDEANQNTNLMADVNKVREQMAEETRALEREIAKLKDPTVHAAIMYTAAREREKTNLILKNIMARIDAMELKLQQLEERAKSLAVTAMTAPVRAGELADIDKTIVSLVKDRGRATAEDIQQALRYKGRNAACARLNRLYEMGILEKQRSGKKILYAVRHDAKAHMSEA
ncbi:MAG: hypothetical protein QW112_03880 [Candidatus Micrarchaeia archaeon]